MNIYKPIINLLFVVTILSVFTASGNSQDIVRVDSDNAEIHVTPESMDSHFIMAQKGDLFELASFKNGWVGIQMFSGNVRYLKATDVEIVSDYYSEQINTSKLIELCQDVQLIEDQALVKANSKYPEDNSSAEAYNNVIIDKDVLALFRSNNIPATQNSIFLDCINDSLVPFLDS